MRDITVFLTCDIYCYHYAIMAAENRRGMSKNEILNEVFADNLSDVPSCEGTDGSCVCFIECLYHSCGGTENGRPQGLVNLKGTGTQSVKT